MAEERWDAVEISRYSWLAWLLGGTEPRVLTAPERGNCTVVVTAERTVVVANNIEAPRLRAEEIGELPLEWAIYNWWEAPPAVVPAGTRVATEIPVRLRLTLCDAEIARAVELGRQAAEALEATACSLEPGLAEHQIAARMAEQTLNRGLVPVGLFVAADERGKQFRHPIPTAKVAHRNAILSLVARRGGLHVSLTRTISFGPACDEMLRRHGAAAHVHAAMLAASRPGVTLGATLATAQRSYEEQGFPDEWQHHHQGGLAGYEPRELRATPGATHVLEAGQLVAWNPTIRGAKSEETALVTAAGPRLLTRTDGWPLLQGPIPLAAIGVV